MSEEHPFDRFMAAVVGLSALAVARPLGADQKAQLDAPLPRDFIKTRPQSGQQLRYIEGWYVIERLNAVFGYDGWSFDTGSFVVTNAGDRAVVYVQVTLRACGVSRADVGVGVTAGKGAEALETAIKAAVTDGLKRAARTFGTGFGNRLYDKAASGVGVSTRAMAMLDEIDDAASVDAVNAWVKANVANVQKLDRDEQDIVKGACAARRRELAVAPAPEPSAEPPRSTSGLAPTPTPSTSPALEGFLARVTAIELPGEAVAVWIKHRDELAALGGEVQAAAWQALCERTRAVGKMAKPELWLNKAIAEEDMRTGRTTAPTTSASSSATAAAAAPRDTEPPALVNYRARCDSVVSIDALIATCLELAPTVAQHREGAWGVAVRRAADLGAEEATLKDLVERSVKVSKDPAVWKVTAEVLNGFGAATSRDAVAAVVKRHGRAVAALPKTISAMLIKARDVRLAEVTPTDAAAVFESEMRAASDIPTLEAVGDKIAAAARDGKITPEQLKVLAALQDKIMTAMEMEPAA